MSLSAYYDGDRFWSRVSKSDGCWEWTGPTIKGYGAVAIAHGKVARAHRLSWEMANGPIPDGLCVCHSCDNRPCVNPSHLFLGTIAENNADKAKKGRACRGEKHPLSKLNAGEVEHIRSAYAAGMSMRSLSRIFSVSRPAISNIVKRKVWKIVQ